MKTVKGLFVTLAILVAAALPHPALADGTDYWLVLSMRDGSTAAHPYTGRPTIVIKNGLFTVKSAICTVDYPATSIDRFRFTDSYAVPKLNGDVNGDGSVDIADIATVITVMAEGTQQPSEGGGANADVNGDGAVDVADIAEIISIMAQG